MSILVSIISHVYKVLNVLCIAYVSRSYIFHIIWTEWHKTVSHAQTLHQKKCNIVLISNLNIHIIIVTKVDKSIVNDLQETDFSSLKWKFLRGFIEMSFNIRYKGARRISKHAKYCWLAWKFRILEYSSLKLWWMSQCGLWIGLKCYSRLCFIKIEYWKESSVVLLPYWYLTCISL